jgi:hypothetical protein
LFITDAIDIELYDFGFSLHELQKAFGGFAVGVSRGSFDASFGLHRIVGKVAILLLSSNSL